MTGAVFALAVNLVVAGLFAAAFSAIARLNGQFRRVRWFAVSYAVGMLTPASELILPLSPVPWLFAFLSSFSFAAAFTFVAAGLAVYYGQPPRWGLLAGLLGAAVALRLAIWGGPRDTLPYEMLYQLPFAVLTALCGYRVLRVPAKRALDWTLGAAFTVAAAHFLVKPYLAMAFGSGATAEAYVKSTYALFSQATTGILLVATGLVLMLVVLRDMLAQANRAAEVDALSGLLNRRGFDLHAGLALRHARLTGAPVCVLLCDLDHFKAVNDTFGHDAGDRVIRALAELLRAALPASAVIGRTGGEEFAVLLPRSNVELARLAAEAVRAGTGQLGVEGLPESFRVTISIGLAALAGEETLAAVMQRADGALYRAKRAGRDRVWLAEDGAGGGREPLVLGAAPSA